MARTKSNGDLPVLSQTTIARLTAAGWSRQRKVDLRVYEAAFAEEHLDLPAAVGAFLTGFGGLIIAYTTKQNREDTLDFLADEAVQGLGGGVLRSYECSIDFAKLFPIGHCCSGTCLLMMDSGGAVFGGMDSRLVRVGQTGPEAIENVLSGKQLEVVSDASPVVSSAQDEPVNAVTKAAAGGSVLTRDELLGVAKARATSRLTADTEVPLTEREDEVLRQMALGLTNKQIAETLQISFETVKEHVQHILGKIGDCERTQASARPAHKQRT